MEGNHPDQVRAARVNAAWERRQAREQATAAAVGPGGRNVWGCLLGLVRVGVGGMIFLVMGVLHPLMHLWAADEPGPLRAGVTGAALLWWGIAAAVAGGRRSLRMLPLGPEMLGVATRSMSMTSGGRATGPSGASLVAHGVGVIVALGGMVGGAALVASVLMAPQSAENPGAAAYVGWTGALALGIGVTCVLLLVRGVRRYRRRQAEWATAPPFLGGRPMDP